MAAAEARQTVEHPLLERRHRLRIAPGHPEYRTTGPHLASLPDHPVDIHIDERPEIGLVDHQQIGPRDTRPALAHHVAATCHIEHEDLHIDQRGGEGCGQIVSARFDQDDVDRREIGLQILRGQQIHRDVIADGGMRAGSGLHRPDALRVQHPCRLQETGILIGVDVIGHHCQRQRIRQLPADHRDE